MSQSQTAAIAAAWSDKYHNALGYQHQQQQSGLHSARPPPSAAVTLSATTTGSASNENSSLSHASSFSPRPNRLDSKLCDKFVLGAASSLGGSSSSSASTSQVGGGGGSSGHHTSGMNSSGSDGACPKDINAMLLNRFHGSTTTATAAPHPAPTTSRSGLDHYATSSVQQSNAAAAATVSQYQYNALLHDRLTAPLSNQQQSHPSLSHSHQYHPQAHHQHHNPHHQHHHHHQQQQQNLSGSNNPTNLIGSSCNASSSAIPNPMRSGKPLKLADDFKRTMSQSPSSLLQTAAVASKVQLLGNKFDTERDILQSLMGMGAGNGGGGNGEAMVDSTSPRNMPGSSSGSCSSRSVASTSTKRAYSPPAAAGGGNGGGGGYPFRCTDNGSPTTISAGHGEGSAGSGSSGGSCTSHILASMSGGASSGCGGHHQQGGGDKKIPNSIRGDNYYACLIARQRVRRWVAGGEDSNDTWFHHHVYAKRSLTGRQYILKRAFIFVT